MKTNHSLISPSNFERRLICPGSLHAEKDLPGQTSVYAEEGKMLHDKVNEVITSKNKLATYENYTFEQEEAVNRAVDYFSDLVENADLVIKEIHEKTFDLSFIYPDMLGTADSILITLDKETNIYDLHVIDYKFGKGVLVNAYNNYQLLLYYLGVINDPEISELLSGKEYNVHLHIVQPYRYNSCWCLSNDEKLKFSDLEMYRDVAKKCYVSNAPRIPNKKACQFCKAKPTCPALSKTIPDVKIKLSELTDAEIANIYDNKDLITMYLKSLEEYIKDKLEQGSFMSYELKAKVSNRKWADEAYNYLSENFGDKVFEVSHKLIGIAKAEKILGKDLVNQLTTRERGKNEIVKIDTKDYADYFND